MMVTDVIPNEVTDDKIEHSLLDSGAHYNMVNELELLHQVIEIPPQPLKCADGTTDLKATHVGVLWMEVHTRNDKKPEHVELNEVLFVPHLACNVFSVANIIKNDFFGVNFRRDHTDIYEIETDRTVFTALPKNGLMYVKFIPYFPNETITPLAMPLMESEEERIDEPPPEPSDTVEPPTDKNEQLVNLWHRRMGHISPKYLRQLQLHAVGIPPMKIQDDAFKSCRTCLITKSTRLPHTSQRARPTQKFELLHMDLLDPSEGAKNSKNQILVITDGFSGYVKTYILEKKSEVPLYFARYHKWLTNRFSQFPTSKIRVDNAREFTQGDMERYCQQAGIEIDSGSPYSPELNGLAERKNKSLLNTMRSLLQEGEMPVKYWNYALKVAEFLINRTPTKTNQEFASPYELIFDKKPDASRIRGFGCVAMMHIPKEVKRQLDTRGKTKGQIKLGPAAEEKILVGFTDTGYELLDLATNKTIVSSDVRFIENENYKTLRNRLTPPEASSSSTNVPSANVAIVPEEDDESSDFEDEHTAARALMAFAINPAIKRKLTIAEFIPKSYDQAVNCAAKDDWIEAINKELDSFVENDSFELVEMPQRANIIDTKWVFRIKFDEQGNEIAKARLTARGFKDSNDYAESEKYSPVCPADIQRVILSVTNQRKMHLYAVDVTTAFLYGDLPENIFVRIPKGIEADSKKYVLKLKKAVYGLKIASKRWHDELKSSLVEFGFQQTSIERCLYVHRTTEGQLTFIATYVDDLLIAADSRTFVDQVVEHLQKRYKLKVTDEPSNFVGVQIHRDKANRVLSIHQSKYIIRAAESFGLDAENRFNTPMETNLQLEKASIPNDDSEFRGLIGIALYIARHSRPDICFAVNKLSQHQGYVTTELKSYARRIIRYLYTTRELKLTYRDDDSELLRAFVDASYAPEQDCRSISGLLIFHCGDLVAWNTRKQTITVMSSTAAEVVAVSDFLDDLSTIREVISELLGKSESIKLHQDNTSAIHILEDGKNRRQRQLRIRTKAVIEFIERSEISILSTPGELQLADALTKPLDRSKFENIRQYLLDK